MEPKGSLPYSQILTTCPYPEPNKSSPCPTSHFLNIHLNINLPSRPGSSKWPLALRFAHQNSVCTSPLPIRATHHAHPILLNLITQIISGEEYRSLNSLLHSFLHFRYFSSLSGPNVPLNTLFSNTLSVHSSLNVSDQVSHPHKTTGKITVLHILLFIFLHCKLEDTRFSTKW